MARPWASPARYVHPSRRRAASKIQRAFRRYRGRKRGRATVALHNQKYDKVQNKLKSVTLKGAKSSKTLKERVKALETSAKKHHDYLEIRPVPILSWGSATNITGQFGDTAAGLGSAQGWLKIPTKNMAGEIQNGSSVAEDQVRDGDEVYIRSAQVQFQLETYKPATGISDASMAFLAANMLQPNWHSRVVFTVIQDRFPAKQETQSTSINNPLPTEPGVRPLETLFRRYANYDAAEANTMITEDYSTGMAGNTNYGAENALMSYDSTRFKKVHQEVIELNAITPKKLVNYRLVINKRAKYMVPPQQTPTPGEGEDPNYPLNFNYLLFVSTTASINPLTNKDTTAAVLACLQRPQISKVNIRTYFTDS